MTAGASEAAFRAQLVLPEQKQLYDYWCSKRKAGALPCREDIHPAEFHRLLPCISLIEIEFQPFRFKYRLAGTKLRDIHDREVTGLYLAECDWDSNQDYWVKTYTRVSQTGKPAQGVIRGPCADKEHLVQFWLRLPLTTRDSRPGMLLCHDAIVPAEEVSCALGAQRASPQHAIAV